MKKKILKPQENFPKTFDTHSGCFFFGNFKWLDQFEIFLGSKNLTLFKIVILFWDTLLKKKLSKILLIQILKCFSELIIYHLVLNL